MSINSQITTISDSIQDTAFGPYVKAVDNLCYGHFLEAAKSLGPVRAKLLLLKVCNLLIAKYEYLHRHITLLSHPVGMLIDPSNGCGLRCPGCVHSETPADWDWPSGLMKEDTFQSFIQEHGSFATELYLANYGEPLLSPLTPRLIKIARQYGLPTFTSSSLSVPSKRIDGIVESGLNFLICSIDGATSDTYLNIDGKVILTRSSAT